MVNIIINDENNDNYNELSEIIKELQEQNNQLEDVILSLLEKMNNIEKNMNKVYNRIDGLDNPKTDFQNITKAIEELKMNTIKNDSPKRNSKKKTINKKRGNSVKDTDVFIPNNAVSKTWNKLVLRKDGSILSKGHRQFVLPIDLNELFYIMEQDNPFMTRGVSKKLREQFNVNISTWGKLIFNIRTNNFDKILIDYNNRIKRIKFKLNDDDLLLIDKANTNIPKKLVQDWIYMVINSNHKEETILKIQEAHPEFDKYHIRMICDNYNNTLLENLVNDSKSNEKFIENNPSKRKNMILNGGLL